MLELLKYLIIRLYGGMYIPVLVLFFFSFWGWKGISKRVRALAWVAACLIAVFAWRIMWLSSSGGRLDRYYVLWGVVGLLLIVPGARGIAWWGRRLHLDRIGVRPAIWWTAFIIAIVPVNLGKALYPPDQKTFVPQTIAFITDYVESHSEGRVVLLDATSEVLRLDYLVGERFPIMELPKLRPENLPEFGRFLLPVWLEAATRYDRVLVFFRQSQQREVTGYFAEHFPVEILQEYLYRDYLYTLLLIEPGRVYTSETLAFMRSFPEFPSTVVIDPAQVLTISFQTIFPIDNIEEWNIEVTAPCGVRDPTSWHWYPEQVPQKLSDGFEIDFTLWDRRNLPVAERRIMITLGTPEQISIPQPPLTHLSPGSQDAIVPVVSGEETVPVFVENSRIMFFGNGITSISGLKGILPASLTLIQTQDLDRCEISDSSQSYSALLRRDSYNSYWLQNKLVLTEGPLNAVVLLLGQQELSRFGAAELLWDYQMNELIGNVFQTVNELHAARPDLKIILATLPGIYPEPMPLGGSSYHKNNSVFYNQAVAKYNRSLRQHFGDGRTEGIFLLPLDSVLGPEDFKTDNAWELNVQGQRRLLTAIGEFLSGESHE